MAERRSTNTGHLPCCAVFTAAIFALILPGLSAQDAKQEDRPKRLSPDEAQRMHRLRQHGQFLLLTIPGQRPTVMGYMFTNSGFGALELTEEQITALSERGKEIQDALEDVTDEESLDRRGSGTVEQLVRRLPFDHREEIDELRDTIEKLREEARSELLEHQLDLLIEQALRHLDLGAIKFEEIAALVDITDAQQESLANGIARIEREFWREAVPGVPSLSPEERQALRAAGVRSVRELQPPRSEEQLAIAYVNREAKVVILLKDVLRPEQLEEVKRLVKIARDE